ncbi:phosphatidylserine decarboxylase-domain-containing protein [Xylariaceae sp. FL0662B]|nr:phosphatidylserine decarboxylase-domain-containing protein [Xylariaceae sp. FL0662B]
MSSVLRAGPDENIARGPRPVWASAFPHIPRQGIPASVPLINDTDVRFDPVIIVLTEYLDKAYPGALDDAVASAYQKIPDLMDKLNITDARSFLVFANDLVEWIPHENLQAKNIYNIICIFYFILGQPALTGLQTPINPNQVGQPLSWLSSWIVVYTQLIGLFMDTPASLTEASLKTFVDSPPYNYDEALLPEGGFQTFNEFFARHLKPGARPIDAPEDDRVIVYPADCTFDNSVPDQSIVRISSGGTVDVKGLQWTIGSLLQGSSYASEFEGGVWMHAFLNTYNYHRLHAPVSGTVLEAKNIKGAASVEVDSRCRSVDGPGHQFLQTRGMVIIDNPTLGKVAVLPIGMGMISSVRLSVKKGKVLKKGDEISYFQFGGSDIVCVFQAKAGLSVEDFAPSPDGTYSKMGTVLAKAPL